MSLKGFKSPIKCEVCRGRVRHTGHELIVGRKPTGIKRMVCERTTCQRTWRNSRHELMAQWPESRRQDMQIIKTAGGRTIAGRHQFPEEVRNWLRERLQRHALKRGDIVRWYADLKQHHPNWIGNGTLGGFTYIVHVIEGEMQKAIVEAAKYAPHPVVEAAPIPVAEPSPAPSEIAQEPVGRLLAPRVDTAISVEEMNALARAIAGGVELMIARRKGPALAALWEVVKGEI